MCIHSGTDALQRPAKFTILAKFSTGRMPGWIGAEIPAAAQASRKRRKSSLSKKNCVSAMPAPASSLRFRFSMSASALAASGCTSG